MSDRNGLPRTTGQVQLHTVRITNVDADEVVQVRTLSRSYGGIGTHFVKRNPKSKPSSVYCAGADCRSDWHRTEWYYRGYFAAELHDAKRQLWLPCVWELTEQSELDMRGRYERGQVWEFSRPKLDRAGNPPVVARLMGRYPENALPAEWDYRSVLMRCYHTAAIDLTTKNPMPPRLLLEPSPFAPGFVPTETPAAADNAAADNVRHKRNGTVKYY